MFNKQPVKRPVFCLDYFPRLPSVLPASRFALREECGFDSTLDAVCATPLEVRIPFFAMIFTPMAKWRKTFYKSFLYVIIQLFLVCNRFFPVHIPHRNFGGHSLIKTICCNDFY